MLEAFLVVPALALTYLLFATFAPMRRRLVHLATALLALVLSAGWWVALVEPWPAGTRPYIGGSTTNPVLQFALGYNGISRLVGSNIVTAHGGSAVAATNLARISRTDLGAEIAWLPPAAVLLGLVPEEPMHVCRTAARNRWRAELTKDVHSTANDRVPEAVTSAKRC